MSTLFWLTTGLAVVVTLLLLAIGIVLTLFREPTGKREGSRKKTQDKNGVQKTSGYSGGDKLIKWLQSVFSGETFAVMAAFVALELALYSSNWFPHLFEWPNILHIPTYGTLILIANLLVKQQKGMTRTLALLATIVAFAIFTALFFDREVETLTARWNAPPATETTRAPPMPERRVARVSDDPCDNVYRTYRLSVLPKPILKARGCTMDWHVKDDGKVILIDEEGRELPYLITKDTPDDLVTPLATKWRSNKGTALVEARFYR